MSNAGRGTMGTSHAATGDQRQPAWYEIRLKGHLDARWAAWFDGMALTREGDGTTRLRGPIADQAALHGLLQRVRDLGLPLLSVRQVDPGQASGPDGDTNSSHRTP